MQNKKVGGLVAGILISLCGSLAFSCEDFSELYQHSVKLLERLGDLNRGQCTAKPQESEIASLISCFEGQKASYAARELSQADLQLSGLYGAITQCFRSGMGRQETGKRSFHALQAATLDDPTFEDAWISFSETVFGFTQESFFQRRAIEMGLGISIIKEVKKGIVGLSALPQTPAVINQLAKLKSI